MDPMRYIEIALVLAGGAALHSAAGFGYGLFSVPLLLLIGLAPYEAIPIVTVATTVQGVTGVWHHRREVLWRLVGTSSLLLLLSIPVGVYLLSRITLLSDIQVRQVFGGLVFAMVIFYAVWQPRPREQVHRAWTIAAMFSGGLLAGLCGMAGPPIVLWAMTHQWSSQRTRATLWALFLAMTPLGLLFLYHRFGWIVLQAALVAVAMVPAVLLGTLPGIWIGNRISKSHLRRLGIALLLLLAAYMICQPLLASQGLLR
jgi:uncharacterized membrane protein YfcA